MYIKTKKGFTLAEMLIVVAIIALLVAISIPIFSRQLEKSREATDAANIRSQYSQVMMAALEQDGNINTGGNGEGFGKINLVQNKDKWQDDSFDSSLRSIASIASGAQPSAGGTAWVEYDSASGKALIRFGDSTGAETTGTVDWSKAEKSLGKSLMADLKTTPGVNTHFIYSSEYDTSSDEIKKIITEAGKYVDLTGDYGINYYWKGSDVLLTVSKTVSASDQTGAKNEWATRILFSSDGSVSKVTEELGQWATNGSTTGFWAKDSNDTTGTYTRVIYSK